jgi:hypothetical protein
MLRHHWQGTARGARCGKYDAWTCEQIPGVIVRHCGHPTALRPYYIQGEGLEIPRKFPRLVEALQAAEDAAGAAGLERAAPIPPSARPGRRRPVDERQAALAF